MVFRQTGQRVGVWICLLSGWSEQAHPAACCARSSANPSLIITDDRAQCNLSVSVARVIAEPGALGRPVRLPDTRTENSQSVRLDVTTLASNLVPGWGSPRWQGGLSLQLASRQVITPARSGAGAGLGDGRLHLGYEYLPARVYSTWKPRGYVYLSLTLPLGRSAFEVADPTQATGQGFYSLSLGTLLTRRFARWDIYLALEGHLSFARSFNLPTMFVHSQGSSVQISPGPGASAGLGIGYSPGAGPVRLGVRVQPRVDGPRRRTLNDQPRMLSSIQSVDLGLDFSYLISPSDSILLAYTDQTLLGPAANQNLSRIFSILFTHRWER